MDSKSMMQPGMVSPRKRMGMDKSAGNMDVGSWPGKGGPMVSPMGSSELSDSQRACSGAVGGSKGSHGMQAAPDHGAMTDHFRREGKA